MKFPKLSLPSKFRISLPEKHKEAGTLPGNEAKKKKILRVAIVLMLGVFAGTVYVNEGAKQQVSPKAELKQENTAKQDVAESKGSAKNKLHITTDISSQNPFWAKDSEQTESLPENQIAGSAAPDSGSAPRAAAGLPVIPNHQPSARLPRIPSPDGQNQARQAAAAPAKIQGVFVGESSSMAIMSDGSVVSEGESFQDSRISWIGGDGIHLENGNTIRYK